MDWKVKIVTYTRVVARTQKLVQSLYHQFLCYTVFLEDPEGAFQVQK